MLSDEKSVRDYLAEKGVVDSGARLEVTPLGGGVSNEVWKIAGDGFAWVLKQSLPKLKVQVDWFSDVGRIEREQEAMLALAPLLPEGSVPAIVHRDPEAHLYVMTCAPEEAACWKDQLMQGEMDARTARSAGRLLRRLHDRSRAEAARLGPAFDDIKYFDELRIDPFHRYLSAKHPELERPIARLVEELVRDRTCFVHGDYSPKNILVLPPDERGERRLVLLDYEVAHWGNPVFDQAYCCGHLMLKGWALERKADAAAMIDAFLDGYGGAREGLLRHLGLMLLARIDGKSTVTYITDEGMKAAIRSVGRKWILSGGGPGVSDAVREAFEQRRERR